MSAQRRVGTRAIQAAVKGCETQVLDALGIAWNSGAGHITCPYPNHADDNPSWRWNATRQRAHCTCTERSHSIFDVVMSLEGVDFEAAKVRIAEILERQDLIRDAADGARFQATDAASLLRPPAEQRDDGLPLAYLAYRLGVAVEEVPRPTTPATGFKALAYFDPPPPKSKAKPKLVGHHPCAVFGTIAADGRRHALRIYVQPEGAGKAELGLRPDGRPRDAKKLAKVTGEAGTAGCAVLWGDPAQAPHLLLAEGVETAAAAVLAYADEISSGAIAVAAAISAVGMEAFAPWPATRRVTVVADRDEAAKEDGRPGSRRGERAARAFCLTHHDRLEIDIALPGPPGESADWLDILRQDGRAAVRAGIDAATRFVATRSEPEERAQARAQTRELERIAGTYPLPTMDTVELRYAITRSGRVKVHKLAGVERDPETGIMEPILVPVATPFGIPARLRHADQADAYGLRVLVEDMGRAPRAVDFDRADLARMGASEIRARLFAAGLRVESEGEAVAVQALKAADPAREILMVRRPGWHRLDGLATSVFVTPAGEAIGAPKEFQVELLHGVRLDPGLARAGSFAGWQEAMAHALGVAGCPHWTLGTIAGLAGVIVDLIAIESCGIDQSGPSTSGKSLAQRLAVSAWSTPKLGSGGLFRSLRVSANAIEAWAEAASGTVLALDELAHADGRQIGKMIHGLSGGVGRGRMRPDATMRESYRWATFVLLSSELSLEETVRRAGGIWQTGMAVRIADVDVAPVDRSVDADTLAAIAGIEQHFGHAGPAFVRALIEDGVHRHPDRLREQVLTAARRIAGADASATHIRAATAFALLLVTGELARAARVLPPGRAVGEAVMWAWERFTSSTDALALDPAEHAITNLQQWLLERWDVTVKSVHATVQGASPGSEGRWHINNRETLAWYDDSAVYLPKGHMAEACGGSLKPEAVARVLDARGLLARRTDERRLAIRYINGIGKGNWYALSRSEFGRVTADGKGFTVHEGQRA